MPECNSSCLLLCYTRFSPLALEITCLILSIIGGIITFLGQNKIPFYIDSKIYKIVFFINIPYFIIMIILNVIFIIFRYYDLINNELNLWGYGLSVFEIYLSIFGIITNLINDALIISILRDYEYASMKNPSKYHMIQPIEWLYTKIVLPAILIIWFNMLLIALTDNFLIYLKIKASYHSYELAIEDEQHFEDTQKKHKEEENKEEDNKEEEYKEEEYKDYNEDINTKDVLKNNNINKDNLNYNKYNINKNKNNNNNNSNNYRNNSIDSTNKDSKIEIKNYVNNNYNININIDNKKDLIASVNALLTDENNESNMKESLKNKEEIKN